MGIWAQAYQLYRNDPTSFRLTEDEKTILKGKNEDARELLPAEDELRLRFDFEAPESEWVWVQPAALKSIPGFIDIASYSSVVIGKAIAKISESVPTIQRGKKDGVYKWFIPPAIGDVDRFRNPG